MRVFPLHMISFDQGGVLYLSWVFVMVGLLGERAITTGWRFEMRGEDVREWVEGSRGCGGCDYSDSGPHGGGIRLLVLVIGEAGVGDLLF